MQKLSKLENQDLFSNRQSHKLESSGLLSNRQSHKHIYTVSEITQVIKGLLEEQVGEVWLEGEISNFKAATSGHFYFSLKDQGALILGAMFAHPNKGLKFKLEDKVRFLTASLSKMKAPTNQRCL